MKTRSLPFLALSLLACATPGPPSALELPEDGPIAVGAVLPDLRFDGVDADGVARTLALSELIRAPEERALALIVVSGGAWCGSCLVLRDHPALLDGWEGHDRVTRFELVIGDRDNAPADADVARVWQERLAADGVAVGADPSARLAPLLPGPQTALPWVVVVDAATLRVLTARSSPSPAEIRSELATALARLDGREPPPPEEEPLVDGIFREHEWALLQTITVPTAPPPDPSNAVADEAAAQALGRALFEDPGLSSSGEIACASCHVRERALSDGRPRARGAGESDRRTPSIALAAHARWLLWDGRADSLWAQALEPLEDPDEMASTRVEVARRVLDTHGALHRAAFPDRVIPDPRGWPARGMPGEPAYDALPASVRLAITQVFVDAGKAIAAYERTFRVGPNRLDRYVAGEHDALDVEERYGLELFVRSGCMQCHWGPRLTDDAFHVIGMPGPTADPGRARGVRRYLASWARADGPFSDHPMPARTIRGGEALHGQLRTPALRGVADGAHFGHAGAVHALGDVTTLYGEGARPEDGSFAGTREPWLSRFGETAQWGLVPFLRVLQAPLEDDAR